MMMLADAIGASINLHSGSLAGSHVSVWGLGTSVQLDGIQRGESKWNVGGILPDIDVVWGQEETPELEAPPAEEQIWGEEKAMDWDFTVTHIEEWDPSKGSVIRNFPASETKIIGDKGVLIFNRDTGELTGGCGFPMQQTRLYTEHCSEIQALIIGYALLGC